MKRIQGLWELLRGDRFAGRIVPQTGQIASLTGFSAGVMAFLATITLALGFAAADMASRWSADLSKGATVHISGTAAEMPDKVAAVMRVLETTPGILAARVLSAEEQNALLTPWLGTGFPADVLEIPRLIALETDAAILSVEGVNQRLAGEVPGAVLDDHGQWRQPLVAAARRLRLLTGGVLVLAALAMAAIITLAAAAALAANAGVIATLRLIGAKDAFIARAFVRGFTLRAFWGAVVGCLLGAVGVTLLPAAEVGFLTELGLGRRQWIALALIPPIAALVAFFATRAAAMRTLAKLS